MREISLIKINGLFIPWLVLMDLWDCFLWSLILYIKLWGTIISEYPQISVILAPIQ
ncbi:uncharacterized protein BDW43DRAFT_270528 [Aspergillus alliaceus]|uniref:uncharacterized protein n=1 Tax=Petromyces alliaceus TaxID=209559 RepID=UPI0012A5485F|nr:uncharacterized protein BDW43DRAFT_270528 [Aspergillus alliaceus]KAB8235521.1 hypothetical protein BDW43DRAFT_270528 [Aspergillus alliaceus]